MSSGDIPLRERLQGSHSSAQGSIVLGSCRRWGLLRPVPLLPGLRSACRSGAATRGLTGVRGLRTKVELPAEAALSRLLSGCWRSICGRGDAGVMQG